MSYNTIEASADWTATARLTAEAAVPERRKRKNTDVKGA
jgi:hypothetical protein